MPYRTPTGQHLEALADCLEKPLLNDTLAWLASWARYYVSRAKAGSPVTVETAARMSAPATWLRMEALAERDDLFRQL